MQLRLIPLYIIVILFAIPIIVLFAIHQIKIENNTKIDKVVHIYKDHDFSQEFLSSENNLDTLKIKMINLGSLNHEPILFKLYDNRGNILRQISFNGSNIGAEDWVHFSFEPIIDSKQKKYSFSISSPTSPNNNTVNIETNNQDEAGLITYYRIESHLQLIRNIYTQFFYKLTIDYVFMVLWSLSLLTIFGVYIRKT